MNTVLAFDIGTAQGWAVGYKNSTTVHSGLIKTAPNRFQSQGMRFIIYERAIRELFSTFKPDIVVFERVHAHSSVQAAQIHGAYVHTLMKLCDEAGLPYEGYGVGQIKKHATGKGSANKILMIEAAKRRYPTQDIITSDVADALHCMSFGLSKIK